MCITSRPWCRAETMPIFKPVARRLKKTPGSSFSISSSLACTYHKIIYKSIYKSIVDDVVWSFHIYILIHASNNPDRRSYHFILSWQSEIWNIITHYMQVNPNSRELHSCNVIAGPCVKQLQKLGHSRYKFLLPFAVISQTSSYSMCRGVVKERCTQVESGWTSMQHEDSTVTPHAASSFACLRPDLALNTYTIYGIGVCIQRIVSKKGLTYSWVPLFIHILKDGSQKS